MVDKPRPSFLPPPRDRAPEKSGFVFPGPTDRVTVNGMTGSGKSTFALWLVSESADFNKKPWIFLDFKGETIITQALEEGIFKRLKVTADIPQNPGCYVVSPDPQHDMDAVTAFLWKIYRKGNTGLFLDEANMVPELRGEKNTGGPFTSILGQGRSKGIPTYVLAQRPVDINNKVFTENNFYSCFEVAYEEDLKKIKKFIPYQSRNFERVWDPDLVLKPYHSRWFDRERKWSEILIPVPDANAILNTLFDRVDRMKKKEKI